MTATDPLTPLESIAMSTVTESAPEPAKVHLVARGINQREAARRIGISYPLLNAALNRRIVPPPRLRAGLAELLGEPDERLWHPSTLARLP